MTIRRTVPASAVPGIRWPAIPGREYLPVFALLQQLEDTQWWPPELLQRRQLRQAGLVLRHALRSVPWYQRTLAAFRDVQPRDWTPERWHELPLLRRHDIQEAGTELHSTGVPESHGKVSSSRTSGSTGRPIETLTTAITALFNNANNLRFHAWHERDVRAKAATIRSFYAHDLERVRSGRPSRWVPGYDCGPIYLMDTGTPVNEQFDWLIELQASYLQTYGSTLRLLLDEAVQRQCTLPGLVEVSTLGEALDPALRKRCREILGVPLHDIYSCQEAGVLAAECPVHPHYHVQSESILLEVLDDGGAPCPAGEPGRVVITSLHNFAMPLIRYELGDLAIPGEPCPCGRGLPTLQRIHGRYRNCLQLPGGGNYFPYFWADELMKVAPVRQAQLVQRTLHEVEALIVPGRAFTDDETTRLREAITNGMENHWELTIRIVDEIPRSASGKFEDVLCLVKGSE